MRDRCHQNDRQHIIGNIVTAIHVRCHGSANVQGRGLNLNVQLLKISNLCRIAIHFHFWTKTTSDNTILQWIHHLHCLISWNHLHLWVLSLLSLFYPFFPLISHDYFMYFYLYHGLTNCICFKLQLTLVLTLYELLKLPSYEIFGKLCYIFLWNCDVIASSFSFSSANGITKVPTLKPKDNFF